FNAGGYFADAVGVSCGALLVVAALRVVVAERPLAGWNRSLSIAAGALAAYAAWSLVSIAWSHAPGRAILECDRVLAYLAALVVFGSVPWSARRQRLTAAALALSCVAVAAVA